MTQGERIRILRKELNLTLEEFGQRIGIKKSSLSLIENGKNNPSEQSIKSICREFNVNEEWLRSGEGDMFRKTEITNMNDYLTSKGASDFEIRIIKAYFELDQDIRHKALEHFENYLSDSTEHSPQSLPSPTQEERVKAAEDEYIKSRSRSAAGTDLSASNIGDAKEA